MTLAGLILVGLGFLIFGLACIPEINRRIRAKGWATRVSNKWQVFGTIAIGSFLSVVDHGSVLVALPQIESHTNHRDVRLVAGLWDSCGTD